MGSISPRDFIDLVYFKHDEGNMDIISCKLKHFAHILELLWIINKFCFPLTHSLEETVFNLLFFLIWWDQ